MSRQVEKSPNYPPAIFSFQGIFFKDVSSAPTLKASFASPVKCPKREEQVSFRLLKRVRYVKVTKVNNTCRLSRPFIACCTFLRDIGSFQSLTASFLQSEHASSGWVRSTSSQLYLLLSSVHCIEQCAVNFFGIIRIFFLILNLLLKLLFLDSWVCSKYASHYATQLPL